MTTNKQTWKQVSISGVTGILMGAGAMKAMQLMTAGELENNAKLAGTSQYDNMSFREAFDAARAELGAGGVFRWHGNIYNTYTAEEWNAMNAEEQDEFAEQVGAEISAEDIDTSDLAGAETEVESEFEVTTDNDSDIAMASEDTEDVNVTVDNDTNADNYNTYTAEEWNAMNAEEQDEFAEQVGAEISAEGVDSSDLAEAETGVEVTADNDSDVAIAPEAPEDVNVVVDNDTNADLAEANEQITEGGEDDVSVLGYGDVTLDNRQTITVEELDVNGQRVAVIDVDQDREADYAISDLNNNQQMDEGEVIDLHTGEAVSFTNDDTANVDFTADTVI